VKWNYEVFQYSRSKPIRYKLTLSPLNRWNLAEIESLIADQKFFVLHAPRQTGKTTCMLALRDHLNKEGKYNALYVNVEAAQAARENVQRGIQARLS
jgi:predicted AAA+ superfamily ATPase